MNLQQMYARYDIFPMPSVPYNLYQKTTAPMHSERLLLMFN